MNIKSLSLKDIRSHNSFKIDFDNQNTLILGPNGIGKTNILESISLLSTGKSFRAEHLRDIVSFNQEFGRIEALIEIENDDLYNLEMILKINPAFENAITRKLKINKVPKTLAKFTELTKSVLFTPEDIQLLTGSPSERRKFMDGVLSQISYQYKKSHSNLIKVIRQRNKLFEIIAETQNSYDQLEFWDNELIKNAGIIHEERKKFMQYLKTQIEKHGNVLDNQNALFEVNYFPNLITPERIQEYRHKELGAQTTLIGPQRDDFQILRSGRDVSKYGSRGQQRTAVLAIKLSEIDYIEYVSKVKPVLLLDDIFSELDETHKKNVLEVISDRQTIITSAESIEFFKAKIIKL